jgi:hypothetical protein
VVEETDEEDDGERSGRKNKRREISEGGREKRTKEMKMENRLIIYLYY